MHCIIEPQSNLQKLHNFRIHSKFQFDLSAHIIRILIYISLAIEFQQLVVLSLCLTVALLELDSLRGARNCEFRVIVSSNKCGEKWGIDGTHGGCKFTIEIKHFLPALN